MVGTSKRVGEKLVLGGSRTRLEPPPREYMAMHVALPQDRHRDLKALYRRIKQW
jgi:hypothetical protein